MSFHTYHVYGYGICVDGIIIKSVEALRELINLAPTYASEVNAWLESNEITEPTINDLLEYDEDECCKIASILKAVIYETEGVWFSTCNNFDGNYYLLYEPSYPWEMLETDKTMTRERVCEILQKYVSIIADNCPQADYCGVENGG